MNSAQVTNSCFAAINHSNGPHGEHKFTSAGSKEPILIVIGRFDTFLFSRLMVVINIINAAQNAILSQLLN